MKALVLSRDTLLEFKDVPDPQRPGTTWALIKVAFSGISNSDIHRGFEGGAYHYPLVMGHEFSEFVEEPTEGADVFRRIIERREFFNKVVFVP
ncbi:MAG: alcohol dehydrogenase catalytic domain-containing protein [Spirochaetia bacterium]